MNKKLFLLPLLLAGTLIFTQYGCSEDDDPEELCEQYEACENLATTCCTEDVCYYEYMDVKYEEDELEELMAVMCPAASAEQLSSIMADFKAHTIQLLNEARSCAICE